MDKSKQQPEITLSLGTHRDKMEWEAPDPKAYLRKDIMFTAPNK